MAHETVRMMPASTAKKMGLTVLTAACAQGCYWCRTEDHGAPCCHGGMCNGQASTPEAIAARQLAQAVEQRIADRSVRVGMDARGMLTFEGLTAAEKRYGTGNLGMYLTEHGTAATRAAIARVEQLSTRTSTTTDRVARTLGR